MKTHAVDYSVRAYKAFLRLYPKSHRLTFGPWMTQLFQDMARSETHGSGLALLWLRTIPDLLKNAFIEHLNNANTPIAMNFNWSKNPRSAFLTTAITVSAALFSIIVLATFWILPVKYASLARFENRQLLATYTTNMPDGDAGGISSQLEIIKSQAILSPVIQDLNLEDVYTKRMNRDRPLTPAETYLLLSKQIKVQQTRGTSLIEVWVYDSDKTLAAHIANQIAEAYLDQAQKRIAASTPNRTQYGEPPVFIRDYAKPGLRPVSPNIPFNLVFGFLGSLIIGVALGILVATAVWLWPRIPTAPRNG